MNNKENVAPLLRTSQSRYGTSSAGASGEALGPSSKFNIRYNKNLYGKERFGKPTLGHMPNESKQLLRRDLRQPADYRKPRHRDQEPLPTWELTRNNFWGGLHYPLKDIEQRDLTKTADWEVKQDTVGIIEKGGFWVDRVRVQAQKVADAVGRVGQKLIERTENTAPNLVDKARHGVSYATGAALKTRDRFTGRLYGPRFKQTWSTAGPSVLDYQHPYPQRLKGLRLPAVASDGSVQRLPLPFNRVPEARREGIGRKQPGENRDLSFFATEDQSLRTNEPGGHFAGSSATSFRNDQAAQQKPLVSTETNISSSGKPLRQQDRDISATAQPSTGQSLGPDFNRREF